MATDKVVSVLDSQSSHSSKEVAGAISANGETEIGDLLSELGARGQGGGHGTGRKDRCHRAGCGGGHEVRPWIHFLLHHDNKAQTVEFESLILLVEKKISSLQSIVPLLESVVRSQDPHHR